jgi:hypothetical protein
MSITGHSAINVWSGRRSPGRVADAVDSSVTGDNGVLQRDAAGTHTNPAAGTFGRQARWGGSRALIDTAVPRLSIISADGSVFDIEGRRIVVGNSATIR